MLDKTYRNLRLSYFLSIAVILIAFVFDVLYTTKYIVPSESVILERWAIIITLGGIYGILKMLHPKLKKEDKPTTEIALKKYVTKYYTRHAALVVLCVFNMSCLIIMGLKNFTFLTIITIFAFFLCIPNKKHLEEETKIIDEV